MHTAQHIVAQCLSGKLVSGRTVLLVTHHVSLCLPIASHLLELSHGAVVRSDSVQTLKETGALEQVIQDEDDPTFPAEEEMPPAAENEADALLKDAKKGPPRPIVGGKLIEVEARAEGRVSMRTYLTYIHAAGVFSWILTLAVMVLIRFINISVQVREMRLRHNFSAVQCLSF